MSDVKRLSVNINSPKPKLEPPNKIDPKIEKMKTSNLSKKYNPTASNSFIERSANSNTVETLDIKPSIPRKVDTEYEENTVYEEGNLVGIIDEKNNIYKIITDFEDKYDANGFKCKEFKYKRYNPKNGRLSDISIYDDENIDNNQYGADQCSFIDNFDELINDQFMWDEMQKYYPVEGFTSVDEAMDFYERYFTVVAYTGCGYAAGANIIFKQYEGREEEFKNTFGFDMYSIDYNGNLDFNYEYMMLLYFNYNWANKYSIETMEKGMKLTNKIVDFIRIDAKSTAAELENLMIF